MGFESTWCKCEGCGRDLTDLAKKESSANGKREPCPDRGSEQRMHFVTIEDGITVGDVDCSTTVKDSSGFLKQEATTRKSHSDKTGRPVIITKEVDRTNPEYTEFYHKVEEYDEHGILLKTIHEHTDKNKAKRRPKKTESDSS